MLHKASLVRIGLICLAAGSALWFSLKNENFRTRGLAWVLLALVVLDLAAVNRQIIHPEKSLQSVVSDGRGGGRLVAAPRLVQDYVPRAATGAGPSAAAISAAVGHERVWPLGNYGGQNLWLADGFHRLAAFKDIGRDRIQAEVIEGTLEDALWRSFGANKTHGLPVTAKQKKKIA